ncbi:hypothetical protein AB0L35_31840 [Streptomyces sp. NPDC052309]|uniref:hypothetical protein n=1 Tax=Streptomyces sp. NPDC052309 TaxID=3155421 RepID=UPI0034152E32
MSRTHRFHLDVHGHSVTVQATASETELLVDGKVVGYQRTQAGHRKSTSTLCDQLPGDPPQSFGVTLRPGDAGALTCVLEVDGRSLPMPETPLGRAEPPRPAASARPVRRIRRLLRRSLGRRIRL